MKRAKLVKVMVVVGALAPLLSMVSQSGASAAQGLAGKRSEPSSSLYRLVDQNLRGKSFRYNISGYISAPDSSQASVFGNGEVDTSSKSVQVSATYGIPPKGYGIVTGPNFPGPKSTFHLVETLQAEYIGGKLFAYLHPKWATWASIDYAQLSSAAALSADAVPNMEDNMYPMLEIMMLPGPGVVVTRSASGTLYGTKLSYYKVSIEPSELMRRVNASTLSKIEKIRIASVLGWRTITCYVGFDSSGRLRQVSDVASTSINNVIFKLDMVENTSKWTHPTRIEAPLKSTVFDRTASVNSGATQLNPGTIQAA